MSLVKLRQQEHSLHFLEGRSELGFSLWHELCRVFWRQHSLWLECKANADLAGMSDAWAGWTRARRDYCVLRWQSGCIVGTAFSLYLMTWRFKA